MPEDSWKHIRPVAVGVPTRANGDDVLVAEHETPDGETFYRPVGGGVDFNERSDDAVIREFREELDAAFAPEARLAVLENRFEWDGEARHELVFVYAGHLVDDELRERDNLTAHEPETGEEFPVVWKPLEDFYEGDTLYPDDLLPVLD
ncbi:NUDIX hydrolase [Halocalculus aciditolerans]|uniref:NUDIX hydrolase n=1 Tax=Halocalculus aciditolerans TaxID=1383812 RepID=A0A830FJF2_9EURY|nr:NUDIX domain-containing protein [Halocalculus aciditolerans]GGL62152.1 NUDIX hydrolase [Halocalculus aciditolerans]